MKVLMDLYDSRREDELIMSNGILIHIYDRCDEVRGKSMEKSSIKERRKRAQSSMMEL